MQLKFFFIIPFLFCSAISQSQVSPEWSTYYGNIYNIDFSANDMSADAMGNVYVYGYYYDTNYVDTGIIIKYNSQGFLQWLKKYPELGPYGKIAVDQELNVYVISRIFNPSQDFLTLKYDSAGVLKWAVTYNGGANMNDMPLAITFDDSLNVYVTGQSNEGQPFSDDFCTIKYNSSGIIQWVSVYGDTNQDNDRSQGIFVDPDHNVYVTGGSSDTLGSVITIKYDQDGNEIWKRKLAGIYGSGFYIKGYLNNYIYVGGTVHYDYMVIKYDTSGNMLWSSIYSGQDSLHNYWDNPAALLVNPDGSVIMTGTKDWGSWSDFATVKFDSGGTIRWVQIYSNGGWDEPFGMATDNSGNIFVAGNCDDTSNYHKMIQLVKYDQNGTLLWETKYYNSNWGGSDRGVNIALDSAFNIYFGGQCNGNFTSRLFAVKYGSPIGIEELDYPDQVYLYPNPFHSTAKLGNGKWKIGNGILKIYNRMGSLVREEKISNLNSYILHRDDLPDGMYFIQLSTSDPAAPSGSRAGSQLTGSGKFIVE